MNKEANLVIFHSIFTNYDNRIWMNKINSKLIENLFNQDYFKNFILRFLLRYIFKKNQ